MVSSTSKLIESPALMMACARGSAKLSAANALPRSDASVMATWMVERKREGFCVSLTMRLALRFPSSESFSILVLLAETTAISAHAKTALRAMSTTCRIRDMAMSPGFMVSFA